MSENNSKPKEMSEAELLEYEAHIKRLEEAFDRFPEIIEKQRKRYEFQQSNVRRFDDLVKQLKELRAKDLSDKN